MICFGIKAKKPKFGASNRQQTDYEIYKQFTHISGPSLEKLNAQLDGVPLEGYWLMTSVCNSFWIPKYPRIVVLDGHRHWYHLARLRFFPCKRDDTLFHLSAWDCFHRHSVRDPHGEWLTGSSKQKLSTTQCNPCILCVQSFVCGISAP